MILLLFVCATWSKKFELQTAAAELYTASTSTSTTYIYFVKSKGGEGSASTDRKSGEESDSDTV